MKQISNQTLIAQKIRQHAYNTYRQVICETNKQLDTDCMENNTQNTQNAYNTYRQDRCETIRNETNKREMRQAVYEINKK